MANGNGGPPPPRPGGPPGGKPPMKKSTRNWMLIGGVGAAGIVVWYIMRARSQASTTSQDPSIDPTTGIPYAQESSSGYGGYGVGGAGVPQQFGYYDPQTGQYITGTGSVTTPPTNASWAQQVEAYLQTVGYDPTTVAAALGKYLTGQTLTSDQQGIVAAGVGFYGNPPMGAPPIVPTTPSGQSGWQSFKDLKIPTRETLSQYAKAENWSAATLAAVEQINRLKPGSQLRRGQVITRPIR